MTKHVLKFPRGFYWGSATSSYQVEGGITNNDWAQAAREKKVPSAGAACDHYNRFREDFDLVKKLNQNAHRFSIEWARIEPEEGKWNFKAVEHYREVLEALRKRNIEPFVSLWHFMLPLWVSEKGGWENKRTIKHFTRYVEFIVNQYQDLAKFWLTLNEPLVYVGEQYLKAAWPPGKKSLRSARRVRENFVKAHRESFMLIKQISKTLRVGVAKHFVYYLPVRERSFLDKRVVRTMESFDFDYLDKIKGHQDFIGLNYYRSVKVKFSITKPQKFFIEEKPSGDLTDMGWEIYPEGIYEILKKLKKYRVPIYIVENGIADKKDQKREKYIVDHLKYIHKAITRERVNVKGYLHWSLLDNFEWAQGFGPKFGLVEVNFKTQKRTIRPSAYAYSKICKENAIIVNQALKSEARNPKSETNSKS